MIISAAMLCGLVAQASTVGWGITGVKGPDGNALDSGSVYVFFVAGESKADTSSWDSISSKSALTTALGGSTYDYSVASGAAGTFSKTKLELSDVGISPSTKYSVYAVILDTTSITDDTKFFVTAASAASTTYADGSSLNKNYSLSASASATASNWKSPSNIPEPSSALLLLMGMAGLALRRKRA